MKQSILILSLIFFSNCHSQNFDSKYWSWFENKDIIYYTVTKTEVFHIKDLTFEIIWENKLVRNIKLGHLKGIKSMKIYKNKKLINTILNIPDDIGLGEIYFRFYDYNLDGNIDFTIPINERWEKYFLFDPTKNSFQSCEDWDYIRIAKLNKKNKQILTAQDGNHEDNRELYQIIGNKIKKIEFDRNLN